MNLCRNGLLYLSLLLDRQKTSRCLGIDHTTQLYDRVYKPSKLSHVQGVSTSLLMLFVVLDRKHRKIIRKSRRRDSTGPLQAFLGILASLKGRWGVISSPRMKVNNSLRYSKTPNKSPSADLFQTFSLCKQKCQVFQMAFSKLLLQRSYSQNELSGPSSFLPAAGNPGDFFVGGGNDGFFLLHGLMPVVNC